MPLLEIKNLTYHYPDTKIPALENINLTIREGEFVLIVGGSGSGKSSLARAMSGLIPDFYGGRIGGSVQLDGIELKALGQAKIAKSIGIVFQDPEGQLIMTNVEQELVFGMENLGMSETLMAKRVMEISGALSLCPFLQSNIAQLSGGLKQKVALAAVMAMQPDILILDEPTSQLDPVAGEEILTVLRRLNEDNGITIILIEHKLERCLHLADRVLFMDQGHLIHDSYDIKETLKTAVGSKYPFVPPLVKLFASVGLAEIPITIKEGREMIRAAMLAGNNPVTPRKEETEKKEKKLSLPLLEVEKLWFSYEDGIEILRDMHLRVYPADLLVIMGENTAGKTTLLKNIRGLLQPARGRIRIKGQDVTGMAVEDLAGTVGYLAQNPNDYLFRPTVREEILFTLQNLSKEESYDLAKLLDRFALAGFAEDNPRDLSTGERQRVAMASVLAANPALILLDEPTRGLDNEMKIMLGKVLRAMQDEGHAIVIVTHDVEFAAEYATEIMLMSRGQVVAHGDKNSILSRSTFYSPQIGKLFHRIDDSVITMEEGGKALREIIQNRRGA